MHDSHRAQRIRHRADRIMRFLVAVFAFLLGGFAINSLVLRDVARSTDEMWVGADVRSSLETPFREPEWLTRLKQLCENRYESLGFAVPDYSDFSMGANARLHDAVWNSQTAFLVSCQLEERRDRFCSDPEERRRLVGLVRGYYKSLRIGEAAERIARSTANGSPEFRELQSKLEAVAPDEVFEADPIEPGNDAEIADELKRNQKRLAETARGLVADGYLKRSDFTTMLGLHMPEPLDSILGNVEPRNDPCA